MRNLLEMRLIYPRCQAAHAWPDRITGPGHEQCLNRVVPGLTICREHVERRFTGRSGSGLLLQGIEYMAERRG